MKVSVHYCQQAKLLSMARGSYDWIHVYSGRPVPPTGTGSYNHLIWELMQRHAERHVFIGKYYPESYVQAQQSGVNAVYIEYTPRIWLRDRLKPLVSQQVITSDRDFVKSACRIIANLSSARILVWGAIHQLAYYRWAFPKHMIAYAHRWYEQPDPRWAQQYTYCDYLLTLSAGAARRAFDQSHALSPVVVTIPNGVDLDNYCPTSREKKRELRSELGLPADKIIAIFPSVLRRKKGTNYLMHWINWCRHHLPDVYFLVVGAFEAGASDIGHEIKLRAVLETSDNVKYMGGVHHDAMPKFYQTADFCLMPTVYPEGMSMASLEALASGLPVICPDRGIFSDYIFHEYNGLLCKPERLNQDGIEAIKCLVKNESLRNTLSINARTYAQKRLSRKRCLENFAAFFDGRLSDIDNSLAP